MSDDGGAPGRFLHRADGILGKLFGSCSNDPKGSVFRGWIIAVVLILIYIVLSIVEMVNLYKADGASKALVVASFWAGIMHLLLAVSGTFILKRFPTSFAIGFFLGLLVLFTHQNLILFAVFGSNAKGNIRTNRAFGAFGFILFLTLFTFSILLYHFKTFIVVAPIDAKGLGRRENPS